ncbi:hypothetical protein LCGC14_1097770 [marine sediment metagenome]|uniref:Uncharacterized protein n=1 Tax=marine sediment metagenome TaxID=412755 RepID=A0A0F9MEU9_9ZZZZ
MAVIKSMLLKRGFANILGMKEEWRGLMAVQRRRRTVPENIALLKTKLHETNIH